MKRDRQFWLWTRLLVAMLLVGLTGPAAVHAVSTGITTLSFNAAGCNLCHFGGTTPMVSLTGPTTVTGGSTSVYTLAITNPVGQSFGGLNVSAPSGVLSTGGPDATSTQTLTGTGGRAEITHTTPKAAMSGTTTFSFQWTAPVGSTTVTLAGWGNAVNGNATASGDAAAMSALMVAVNGTPTHDAIVLAPKPLKVKVPNGTATVVKNIKVAVRNGNTTTLGPADIKLQVSGCGGVAGTPDFDPDMLGAQDTVLLLEPGKSKKAVVPLTIDSMAFASFNAKSPARCQITFTATADVPMNGDPALSNNVANMELTVLDLNDAELQAVPPNHESVTASLKPVKVKIRDGALSVTKTIKLKVTNADDEADPGHAITVTLGAGTCVGVGLPDFNKDTPAIENTVSVESEKTATGVVTLTLAANDYPTTNAKSPARCTQQLCLTGPMGSVEPNTTNDCTELVLDVFDANDL